MRKTRDLIITAEGRDKGKTFKLTEMSAWNADRWANRVLLALINAGAEISDAAANAGIAGLAAVGIPALKRMDSSVAQPLLDEMLNCIEYLHDPRIPAQRIIAGDACQIEEVATFWTLRGAVLELHTGFSLAGAPPTTA